MKDENHLDETVCLSYYITEAFFSFIQVMIEAVDNGQPPQRNTKVITVTVPRDASKPRFQNMPFTLTIDETRPAGDYIYTASATDNWRVSGALILP